MKAILGIVILVLNVLAIMDCLKSNKDTGKKALWIILILIFPIIGLVFYYLIGRK